MRVFNRGLYLNQDGGAGGGGAASASAATSTGGAAAGSGGSTSTGATAAPPPAFDWKTSGMDDAGLAIVNERGWKGPGDMLTSYRNLETAVGVPPERLIKLPAERDAGDPKVWDAIFQKMGKPASADKYAIPLPEGDKGEFAKVAAPWFHEANLTQSQVSTLATKWNTHVKAQQEAARVEMETKNAESVTKLKQEWGSQYDVNAAVVDRAAEAFGMTQEQLNGLKEVLGPHGAMTFLHNIGSKLGVEGSPKGIDTGSGEGFTGMTQQQAAAELARVKADPSFAQMFNSADPKQRAEVRAKIDRLAKLAAPGVTPYT